MYEDTFGTYHAETDIMTKFPDIINNVQDAAIVIADFAKDPKYMRHNNAIYSRVEKLGDLHIFIDGSKPMEFIPAI